jgi:tetratricopeptide (TPR) repeat protein
MRWITWLLILGLAAPASLAWTEATAQAPPGPGSSDVAAYYNRGVLYLKRGELDRALAEFGVVLRLQPDNLNARYNRGVLHLKKGALDQAIADFDAVLDRQPGNARAHYNRGVLYLKKGELDRALADFDATLRLEPGNAGAHYNRGLVHLGRGELDAAWRDYGEVLTLDPSHDRARGHLAALEARLTLARPAELPRPAAPDAGQPEGQRVALVLGNGAYVAAPTLRNPTNDARAIADLLERLGFAVSRGLDLDRTAMEARLAAFTEAARGAELAMVFYAGHGLQVDGTNYLLPTDGTLEREADLQRLIAADRLVEAAARAKRLALIILDACRDNPLVGRVRAIAAGSGLALMWHTPANVLIAYATAAGATAADGTGNHSPFTAALLEHLATPGLEVRLMLGRVRDVVAARTGGGQVPFTYGSLGGEELHLAAAR